MYVLDLACCCKAYMLPLLALGKSLEIAKC